MVFKIYYKDKSIIAISKKKMNYDFIINDNLSKDFINGNKNPSEYQIYNFNDKIYISEIDKLDHLCVNDTLFEPNYTLLSNSIKITLYELTNSLSIELTDKHKEYILTNNRKFKIIIKTDEEHMIFYNEIDIEKLLKNKKIYFTNIDIKNADKIITSNCSLNVFIHKTKKGKIFETNALLDFEVEYNSLDNDVEIQLYKNNNQYSISVIMKNNIIPNIDITNWIIGIVDKHDKNKLYYWFNVPIDILLEKKQYHTGFISDKNLKNSILIGRNIFDKIGIQWK